MDEDKQRQIASKGGRAAHEKGTAHEFTADEAREAGRKGGEAVSRDREHMATIGREGGLSARGGRPRRSQVAGEHSGAVADEDEGPAQDREDAEREREDGSVSHRRPS
jgi:hypothetical protein